MDKVASLLDILRSNSASTVELDDYISSKLTSGFKFNSRTPHTVYTIMIIYSPFFVDSETENDRKNLKISSSLNLSRSNLGGSGI